MANDWLVGADRRDAAGERIISAATDLIARRGYDEFSIDALAAKVHCSAATIYRQVGGKSVIRDIVTARAASEVVQSARSAIADLHGAERVVIATVVALRAIRTARLGRILGAELDRQDTQWITDSGVVTKLAQEMIGSAEPDPLATQWLIRAVLALWFWPPANPEDEEAMVRRFLGPCFEGLNRE